MRIFNRDFSDGLAGWKFNHDVTPALDNADFGNKAPSGKFTHSTSTMGWGGAWRWIDWDKNTIYDWEVLFKAPNGTQMYMQANFYDAVGVWLGDSILPFTATGAWQTVSGRMTIPPGFVKGNIGFFFKDDTPANYAASLGVAFRLDDLQFTEVTDEKVLTGFQPTLPAEQPFSDAELAFMDESPPGLFPENQDSNFGFAVRKIFSDRVQELINQLDTIYNEKFVSSSLNYLSEWEIQVGLPVAPTGWTLPQRRNAVTNRLRKGAFTNAARRSIVENFITITFGPAPAFDASGLPLDAGGIPLYSGVSSLDQTYVIRENWPGRNMLAAADPSFEAGVTGWSNDASLSAFARSAGGSGKFGSFSARGVAAVTAPYIYWQTGVPVSVGKTYGASVYIYSESRAVHAAVGLQFRNGAGTQVSLPVTSILIPQGKWTRVSGVGVAPATAVDVRPIFYGSVTGDAVIGDVFYWDGAMVELDPVSQVAFPNSGFEFGIAPWYIGSAPGPIQSLTPFTGDSSEGAASMQWAVTGGSVSNASQFPYITGPKFPVFKKGCAYRISFDAKQPVGSMLQWFSIDNGAAGQILIDQSFTPTASWQNFSFTFTPTIDCPTPQIFFFPDTFGLFTLRLDNFKIENLGPSDWSDPAQQGFFYEVRLLNTLGVDIAGLTRELARITPAGITFAITQTPSP